MYDADDGILRGDVVDDQFYRFADDIFPFEFLQRKISADNADFTAISALSRRKEAAVEDVHSHIIVYHLIDADKNA